MEMEFTGDVQQAATLEICDGLTARVRIEADDTGRGLPWEEEDGHGIIREGRANFTGHIQKSPGEVVIWRDRSGSYVYDVKGTIAKARKEGWGLSEADAEGLTRKQVIAEAVRRDMERMRGYLYERWWYVGVIVELRTADDEVLDSRSLWGIENDSGDAYFAEVANDLLHELRGQIIDKLHDLAGELQDRAGKLVDTAEIYARAMKAEG